MNTENNAVTLASAIQSATVTPVTENFFFKAVKNDADAQEKMNLPNADHEVNFVPQVDEETKAVTGYKRESETHELPVLTPESIATMIAEGVEEVKTVVTAVFTELAKKNARESVNAGITPTINWVTLIQEEYDRLTKVAESAVSIPRELLKEVSEKVGAYLLAQGKNQKAVTAIQKMITGRFGKMSTSDYKPVMEKFIIPMFQSWYTDGCTEEEQIQYEEVTEYLLGKAEESLKEPEPDTLEDMFG